MSFDKETSGTDLDAHKPRDLENQDVEVPANERRQHRHHHGGITSLLAVEAGEVYEPHPERNASWYQTLLDVGIEENGIKPVPVENRTSTQYSNLFTIFFTSLLCLLP